MNTEIKKTKFQHRCEVDRSIYGNPGDKGFSCQFQGLYVDIREKHYNDNDFYDDFYKCEEKYYCPFHAPMNSKKALGNHIESTKEELLGSFYDIEVSRERKQYLNKFYNTIYGIINRQIGLFSKRIFKEDYGSTNEEKIMLYGTVFPVGLLLTKDKKYCKIYKEYEHYLKSEDTFIPFLDFGRCEFNGTLTVESGPQKKTTDLFTKKVSQKIYPELFINGASFSGSIFKESIKIIGVNFAHQELKKSVFSGVTFDNAKFQCRFISFENSIFENLSLKNSQIFSYHTSFENILVHSCFDMSCDDEMDYDAKRIKSRSNGVSFYGGKFGDKDTYDKIRAHDDKDGDVGGKMICQNRIFDCDISFFNCFFYQAPDFYNTKFNKNVNFEFSNFFQSCYKHRYYNLFRYLRFEMSRKNLYREEARFWRFEEKCLEKKTTFINNWTEFFIYKIKYPFRLLSKKARQESSDIFTTNQGFLERLLSKIFDVVCKRGTSFNRIILSIILLPSLVFPLLYACESIVSECIKSCEVIHFLGLADSFGYIKSLFLDSFNKSIIYTFDPFHKVEDKINNISFELIASYLQSIIQITIYVIFGFMLRKRFRISS